MSLSEFEIIQRYFNLQASLLQSDTSAANGTPRNTAENHVIVKGIGDDCAVLAPTLNTHSTLSIDTLVSGVHFPVGANGYDVGRRALAVSLSDLAAMGAEPSWFMLALTLPDVDENWLEGFSRGIHELANRYHCELIGGDTTKGPMTISVQVGGVVPEGSSLCRDGANEGDDVYVTGYLGDGAAALFAIEHAQSTACDSMSQQDRDYLDGRFYSPTPRCEVGKRLRGIATSAIDISDGLIADVGHIARASQVGIELVVDQLPISLATRNLMSPQEARYAALAGGDDYELCFTLPQSCEPAIQELQEQLGIKITKVGSVNSGEGVTCFDSSGEEYKLPRNGYQHFA